MEEKDAQPTERTAALWWLSSKMDSRIWVNFTRNVLRLVSRHQEPPHTDVSRNLATAVVRGILPVLRRRRTGLSVAQWSKVLFSEDSFSPAHTAKSTKSWLINHGVGVLDWPANSPDLNPIENLWGIVKRKIRNKRPKNADEMKASVKETWASIPPQQFHKLITSMPLRI